MPPRWSTSSCAPTSRCSFTELSDETGLARSTTSRLLAALERTELVERDAAGGYVAGPLFALHAALHDPWPQIARLARPVLETVGEQTGETVHLGVRRGEDVVHIAQVESTYLLSARDWNQVDVPPHCSSLGKVLYAFDVLPAAVGRLERRTDRTITTREALDRRARHDPAAAATPPPSTSSRPGSPVSPRPSRDATACSPRSASPGPPPGSRTGPTASVGSSSSRPTHCRRCCSAGPSTAPPASNRSQEGAA